MENINEAIRAANGISETLVELRDDFNEGLITKEQMAKNLETLHRHHANELTAMIANLSYEVRS